MWKTYKNLRDDRFKEFVKASRMVANFLKEKASEGWGFTVLCHLDADGISSGAIVGRMLIKLEAAFQISVLKRLNEDSLKHSYREDRVTIITDMGSGSLKLLAALNGSERVAVLDHHQPSDVEGFKGVHLNPHLHGLNGAIDLSGSGVCYLVARMLDESNVRLSPLAVVGAVGDMQNRNEDMKLRGFNRVIVDEAVSHGLLEVKRDLLVAGRETKPIHRALASTMTPFIPGISGEEDKALAFLTNIDIPVKEGDLWRTMSDLNEAERRRLLDNLVAYMASKGVAQTDMKRLVGEVYILTKEQRFTPLRECREYAALLNACGRLGRQGLGLAIAMGDRRRGVLEEAWSTLSRYRGLLAELISSVVGNPSRLIETGQLVIVNGLNLIPDTLLSVVASIVSTEYDKPLIAFTGTEEGMIKISARAPKTLVEKGLNLSRIMTEAAESVGGFGGGHDVAAGALIPLDRREEFLKLVVLLLSGGQTGRGRA